MGDALDVDESAADLLFVSDGVCVPTPTANAGDTATTINNDASSNNHIVDRTTNYQFSCCSNPQEFANN